MAAEYAHTGCWWSTARTIAVGRALHAGAPEGKATDLQQVALEFHGPVRNRLGEDEQLILMGLQYSADDLKRARFDRLSLGQVAALATDAGMPVSAIRSTAGQEWCVSSAAANETVCRWLGWRG